VTDGYSGSIPGSSWASVSVSLSKALTLRGVPDERLGALQGFSPLPLMKAQNTHNHFTVGCDVVLVGVLDPREKAILFEVDIVKTWNRRWSLSCWSGRLSQCRQEAGAGVGPDVIDGHKPLPH